MRFLTTLSLAALLPTLGLAQTWTNCDPLKRTDCPSEAALGTNVTFDFQREQADKKLWNVTNGKIDFTPDGAHFTIKQPLDSPTMQTMFYIFFGRVETIMRAATGKGIVSSIVIQSEALDEIDWEWVGANHSSVQSNYFGKGDTTTFDRGAYHDMAEDPMMDYHNYTTIWTKEQLEWWIDNRLIRTLKFADAQGGDRYPQTPSTVRLGIWPAGDPKNDEGVRDWAGGVTDYGAGPYTMTVRSVYIEDFTSGSVYSYGDTSGRWQSIKVETGASQAFKEITKPRGVSGRWNAMSKTAQIAIIACAIGGAVIALVAITWCCIVQRRAGRRERAAFDQEFEKGQNELMDYRRAMQGGGFAQEGGYGQKPPAMPAQAAGQAAYYMPNNRF